MSEPKRKGTNCVSLRFNFVRVTCLAAVARVLFSTLYNGLSWAVRVVLARPCV